jgi:hypothetical protein
MAGEDTADSKRRVLWWFVEISGGAVIICTSEWCV